MERPKERTGSPGVGAAGGCKPLLGGNVGPMDPAEITIL